MASSAFESAEVLSNKQQRATLNAQRGVSKGAVKGLRNVINLPYENYE